MAVTLELDEARIDQRVRDAIKRENLAKFGDIVTWSLRGVSVDYDELIQVLRQNGFDKFIPNSATAKRAMNRALATWLKDRAGIVSGDEDEDADSDTDSSTLIRKIQKRDSDVIVFVLETEKIDYRKLGLSYTTSLRIRLEKPKARHSYGQDLSALNFACTTTATGNFDAVSEAKHIEDEIRPYWEKYRTLCSGVDVSATLRKIVTGALQGVALKSKSGWYFVPAAYSAELERLQALVESLPVDEQASYEPYMIASPQIDVLTAKAQLAKATHAGFVAELSDLKRQFGRILDAEPGTVRQSTIVKFLAQFDEYQEKADLYAQTLHMRGDVVMQTLAEMRRLAKAVKTSDAAKLEKGEDEVVPGPDDFDLTVPDPEQTGKQPERGGHGERGEDEADLFVEPDGVEQVDFTLVA